MFDPNRLVYLGRQQGIDVFDYSGVRINAAVADERSGRMLYLGFGRGIPDAAMPGLMAWFGLDWRREFAEYQFPDRSYYFVQRTAA